MKVHLRFTVSESKRLIAKGVAALPEVRRALKSGMIVVSTGSTNSYLYEELTGTRIDLTAYRSGLVLPAGKSAGDYPGLAKEVLPDLVLRDGKPVSDLDRYTAVEEMGPGDVFIKGANALSPDRRLAAVLVGASDGGTVGRTIGHILGKGIALLIPVGLEKVVADDILESARLLLEADAPGPRLAPLPGRVFTEIEALQTLTGVRARQIAAGGVGGAEGTVWLLVEGSPEEVAKAQELAKSVRGEPPWLT